MSILAQLERDLSEAARKRLTAGAAEESAGGGQPRAGGWRRRLRWAPRAAVATGAGAAVALGVALLALALVGHQRQTPRPAAPAHPTSVELRRLIDAFAVLRRPQTAADRGLPPFPGRRPIQFLPRFTRLAARLPEGEHVFLTVSRVVSPQLGLPVGRYVLSAWVTGPRGLPASGARSFIAAHAVVLAGPRGLEYSRSPTAMNSGPHGTTWVSIVPDGVRAVEWTFPGQGVLVFVAGNLATARVSEPASVAPEKVVWEGAHGRFIGSAPGPMRILYGDGIAGARFGDRVAQVAALLSPLLGRPSTPFTPVRCGSAADYMIAWRGLTTFFRHGRFVGYAYGAQTSPPSPSPRLATARGLTLGQTIRQVRLRYSRALRTSTRQGGTWFLRTPQGMLDGFSYSPMLKHGDISPKSVIVSIQAGPGMCAALSP